MARTRRASQMVGFRVYEPALGRLKARAAAAGLSVHSYARLLLLQALDEEEATARRPGEEEAEDDG